MSAFINGALQSTILSSFVVLLCCPPHHKLFAWFVVHTFPYILMGHEVMGITEHATVRCVNKYAWISEHTIVCVHINRHGVKGISKHTTVYV